MSWGSYLHEHAGIKDVNGSIASYYSTSINPIAQVGDFGRAGDDIPSFSADEIYEFVNNPPKSDTNTIMVKGSKYSLGPDIDDGENKVLILLGSRGGSSLVFLYRHAQPHHYFFAVKCGTCNMQEVRGVMNKVFDNILKLKE